MKLMSDCIPCNLKAALMAIRELTDEESEVRDLLAKIMEIPAMRGRDWSITGSQLVEQIFARITDAYGQSDPFQRTKALQNEKCLGLYPQVKRLVSSSEDPLYAAINLSVTGNSLDPMGYLTPDEIEQAMQACNKHSVSQIDFLKFKNQLKKSRQVIYLGDNCGEVVFDKILIEVMKAYYEIETTFVVRSMPTLNDVTLNDAKSIGMDDTATIVENGIDGPLPGTILSRCSRQLQGLWTKADLIISKGGGNFDSLDEDKSIVGPLYYLLMCKCRPYEDYFNVPLHHPILRRSDWNVSRD